MYMDCQAGNKFCWLGCGDLGRNKVCPLWKHRGAEGWNFKTSVKEKTVLSFFVTSRCCWDLINPFNNLFLDLICFILALYLRNKCKPFVYSSSQFKAKKIAEMACEACCRLLWFFKKIWQTRHHLKAPGVYQGRFVLEEISPLDDLVTSYSCFSKLILLQGLLCNLKETVQNKYARSLVQQSRKKCH